MRQTTLYESPNWRFVSYGNGTAYALYNLISKRSVFWQGDDTFILSEEIEALENIEPFSESYEKLFGYVWQDYETVSDSDD